MDLEQFETKTVGYQGPTRTVWIPLTAPTQGPVEEEWPPEIDPDWDENCKP